MSYDGAGGGGTRLCRVPRNDRRVRFWVQPGPSWTTGGFSAAARAHGEQAGGERRRGDEPSHEAPPIQPPITKPPVRMTL